MSTKEDVAIDALSFRGSFTHAVDPKGRLSLPADFRLVLDQKGDTTVVVTNYISDGHRCLEGFARSDWLVFEKRLRTRSRFAPKLQSLENYYLARAAECVVDSGGRILIPHHLRQYATLEREVTFTASVNGFRMWDSRVWEALFAAAEAELVKNPEIFADVDLERS